MRTAMNAMELAEAGYTIMRDKLGLRPLSPIEHEIHVRMFKKRQTLMEVMRSLDFSDFIKMGIDLEFYTDEDNLIRRGILLKKHARKQADLIRADYYARKRAKKVGKESLKYFQMCVYRDRRAKFEHMFFEFNKEIPARWIEILDNSASAAKAFDAIVRYELDS